MPDGDDGSVFSVDIDALSKSAQDLEHVRDLMATICGDLVNTVKNFTNLGGNGDIGKSFKTNYEPNAKDGVEFLTGLNELFKGNSTTVNGLPGLFNDVNQNTTNDAGGPGRKR